MTSQRSVALAAHISGQSGLTTKEVGFAHFNGLTDWSLALYGAKYSTRSDALTTEDEAVCSSGGGPHLWPTDGALADKSALVSLTSLMYSGLCVKIVDSVVT